MSAARARKPGRVAAPKPPPSLSAVRTSEEAAALVALYDAPGYLSVSRAVAALWLLEKLDGGHLSFTHDAMDAEDLQDWCRGICKDAIEDALLAAETAIREATVGSNAASSASAPPGPVAPRSGAGATANTT